MFQLRGAIIKPLP